MSMPALMLPAQAYPVGPVGLCSARSETMRSPPTAATSAVAAAAAATSAVAAAAAVTTTASATASRTANLLESTPKPSAPAQFQDVEPVADASDEDRRYYLAVDCGGTKAAAAIACSHPSPGTIIGVGTGGPANWTDISTVVFLRNVRSAIEDACVKAGLIPSEQVSASRLASGTNSMSASTTDLTASSNIHRPLSEGAFDQTRFMRRRPDISLNLGPHEEESEADEIQLPQFQAAWFGVAGVDSARDVVKLKPHLLNMLKLEEGNGADGDDDGDGDGQGAQDSADASRQPPAGGFVTSRRSRLVVANDTSLLAAPLQQTAEVLFSPATVTPSSEALTTPSAEDNEEQTAVVVIAGTGSIVTTFRRDDKGAVEPIGRSGGYGWLLGDEGSAFAVGREAVRRVLERDNRERLLAGSDDALPSSPALPCEVPSPTSPTFSSSFKPPPSPSKRTGKPKRGHLLRDRLLKQWRLQSTDELLSAVYKDRTAVPWSQRNAKVVPPTPTSIAGGSSRRGSTVSSERHSDFEEDSKDAHYMLKGKTLMPYHVGMQVPLSPTHRLQDEGLAAAAAAVAASAAGGSSQDPTFVHQMGERKHRLASLSTLVFNLAFRERDPECLHILRTQARQLAQHIMQVVASTNGYGDDDDDEDEADDDEHEDAEQPAAAAAAAAGAEEGRDALDAAVQITSDSGDAGSISQRGGPSRRRSRKVDASRSVLCTGGSLLGEEDYRRMLEDECRKMGNVNFNRCVFISRPATSGAKALAQMWERDHRRPSVAAAS